MKLKYWTLFFLALVLCACSNDDGNEPEFTPPKNINFKVVGQDLERVYLFSFNGNEDNSATTDLSEELGISLGFLTLRQNNDVLSFYSFSEGFFSLATKDVNTGAVMNYDNFFFNTSERSITWGIDNTEQVVFGYFGPDGARNLNLLDFGLDSSTEQDIPIEFNVDNTSQPLLFDNRVYITYRDNLSNNKLTYYDIETGSLGPEISSTESISYLITSIGELAIVKTQPENRIELFDSESFTFLERISTNRSFAFQAGPIVNATLIDNRLYFNEILPQPSQFLSTPAVFDLINQDTNFVDIGGVVDAVELELNETVFPTISLYDPGQDVFFMAYGLLNNQTSGGVLVISGEGEILEIVELPFLPTFILRN